MLVFDYVNQVINSRPYQYSTKQSLIHDIKRLVIADLDIGDITLLAMISWPALDEYENYLLWVLTLYLANINLPSSRIQVKLSDLIIKRMWANYLYSN